MSLLLYNKYFKVDEFPYNSDTFIGYQSLKKDQSFLIVPTSKLVRKLKLKFIKTSEISVPDINIFFNIKSFVKDLFYFIFKDKNYVFVSDSYRRVLFEEAIDESECKIYSKKNMSPALLEKLETIIIGLKEKGLSYDNLREQSEKDGVNDNNRLDDIELIYKKYQEKLSEGYLDYAESLKLMNEYIEKNKNVLDEYKKYRNLKFILLNGFSQFNQPESVLFRLIASSEIPFAINIDLDEQNAPVFGNLQEIVNQLRPKGIDDFNIKKLFVDNIIDKIPENYDKSAPSVILRKWLFRTDVRINSKKLSESINIIKCDNIENEVKNITKLTKYLILEKNYKPYDICITSRKPQKYADYFRQSFSEYNIPCNISDRFSLDRSIVISAVFSALDLVMFGFRKYDLIKFLNNPFISFSREIDVNLIEEVIEDQRIFGGVKSQGFNQWIDRIEKSISFYKVLYEKKDLEYYESKSIDSNIKKLENVLEFFNIMNKEFLFNNIDMSVAEFSDSIKINIIKKLNIKENIIKAANEVYFENNERNYFEVEELEKNSRAFSAFINLLEEFQGIYSDRYSDKKFRFNDLYEKLKILVSGAKFNIREKQNYGVEITSIEQTRGIPYKVIMLCGAVDGEFPVPYQTDTFMGMELKDAEIKHIREEQMQFYQFLSNNPELLDEGKQKIFIFYSLMENEKELVKSHFIESLTRLLPEENENIKYNFHSKDNLIWFDAIASLNEYFAELNADSETLNYNQEEYILNFKNDYFSEELLLTSDIYDNINHNYFDNLKKNKYSISALENYQDCPFQYFVRRILFLNEKDEIEKGLSNMESGNILHSILYNFCIQELNNPDADIYIFENNQEIKGIKLDKSKESIYLNKLIKIAEYEFKKFDFGNVYFEMEKNNLIKKNGILESWLKYELHNFSSENNTYLPALFEFDFSNLYNKNDNKVKFKGKIDRVDISQKDDFMNFKVIDYKRSSGSFKSDSDIENGKSFQMPVYIRATEKYLNDKFDKIHYDSAIYYPLILKKKKKKDKNYHKEILKNNQKTNNILEFAMDKINDIVFNKISIGQFDVIPREDAICEKCQFNSICKIKSLT